MRETTAGTRGRTQRVRRARRQLRGWGRRGWPRRHQPAVDDAVGRERGGVPERRRRKRGVQLAGGVGHTKAAER